MLNGSRMRTRWMGKGSYPERSHSATPVQTSRVRSPSLYQSRVSFCQAVSGFCTTGSREG